MRWCFRRAAGVGSRGHRQARRRRPAGASAAPVILGAYARLHSAGGVVRARLRRRRRPCHRAAREAVAEPPLRPPRRPADGHGCQPGLRLKKIGDFDDPVYVTAPPGDRRRVFVVEQGGTVRIVRGGNTLDRPFLDVSGSIATGSERGLLSLAFAPDYASSGLFYVYYTAPDGDIRIVEYRRASAERADHDSARVVLSVSHPEGNHNGGLVLFGPGDLLYAGLGDGGGGGDQHGARGNGQNRQTLLGKIIRIDPRASGNRPYRVPRATRTSAAAACGRRSSPTACATRGASRSRRTATSWWPTSARAPSRRSPWCARRARTSAGACGRAALATRPARPRLGPRATGDPALPLGRQLLDHRRRRGARPVLSALRGRYVFGDFCTGQIESAVLRGNKARKRPKTRRSRSTTCPRSARTRAGAST